MNEKNLDFITFGCKLNMFESEIMREKALENGLENITFFNTCAVTNEAIRQARQRIRKEKRNYPNKRIIVTGCAAQLHPEELVILVLKIEIASLEKFCFVFFLAHF